MADTVPTETVSLNYEEIKWTYSKADADGDSFDFAAERNPGETAELLLPAVQQVVEDSTLSPDGDDQPIDSFQFAPDDGGTAFEYKLDGVMISNYDVNGSGDEGHDRWIDVLSTDWGGSKATGEVVREAGLRSDGELVQAVSDADVGGDFIL